VAAAAVLLLLASSFFAYNFYDKNKKLEDELAGLRIEQSKMDERMAVLEKEHEMMMDPNITVVNLKGMEKSPGASASVYWDSTSTNVYLVAKNMPQLPGDKQYQLWAIIDGAPKDMGLFDVKNDGTLWLKMLNVQKAEAFAITMEDRGHSGPPTMPELRAMGKTAL